MIEHEVLDRVDALATYLRERADETEELGRIPDETAKRLKDTGVVRLLQPKAWGGYEADPLVFFEAVMRIARNCGASGWVAGIVGIHPWEIGVAEPQLQEEIWGDDVDRWVASTYMPTGKAVPVDGGYRLSGRWQFSSGCEVAEWIILGGVELEADGSRPASPKGLHLVVPQADYTIVDGTWEVIGLRGTGSKDIVVEDVFVPAHRVIERDALHENRTPGLTPESHPIFRMPWAAVFPNAITSAVIGIAEGALQAALDYQRDRVSITAGPIASNPVMMTAIGEAASEIGSARAQLMANVGEIWDIVSRGGDLPLDLRARGRRDQVRGAWRVTRAVDDLFDYAGGGSLRTGTPLQRLWRDAHAGLHHVVTVPDKAYHSYASVAMGADPLENML